MYTHVAAFLLARCSWCLPCAVGVLGLSDLEET